MSEYDYRARALAGKRGLAYWWLWWTYDVQNDKSVPASERTRIWDEQSGDRAW